jgi:osmotically inducible protein OsmC
MATTRNATTVWQGSLLQGSGQVTLESSGIGTFDVSWPARSEAANGKTSAATGFKDTCPANPGLKSGVQMAAQPCSGASASFPLPLPKRLSLTNFGIVGGGVEDPECNGSFEKPTAPPGHLCIYPGNAKGFYSEEEAEIQNIAKNGEGNWDVMAYVASGTAGRYGFRIEAKANTAGPAKFFASWAYTAPVTVLDTASTDATS